MRKSISKRIALFLLAGLCAVPAGCGSRNDTRIIAFVGDTSTGEYYEICQELWQGVSAYATESGEEATIYTPDDPTVAGVRRGMLSAIEDGADVIVCVGDEMANAVYDLQQQERETEFILIDGIPTDGSGSGKSRIRGNTYSIVFNREEAGFLAGYAAVMEGYRQIGFLGGSAGSDDRRYGSGFVQGAEAAGTALGYTEGEVDIRYRLTTSNAISPTLVSQIGEWFEEGCELICVCGSGPEFVGPEAAGQYGGRVITADMNRLEDSSSTIAASGINHIAVVQLALKGLDEGTLKGGRKNVFGLADGGVSMKLRDDMFEQFTQEDLDRIAEAIGSGEIEVTSSDVVENPEKYEIAICRITGIETEEEEAGEEDASVQTESESEADAGEAQDSTN